MTIESIKVPDLGGASSAEVIEICVAVGDQINVDDSIVVLESDKASMEVPSPKAGKVVAINVSDGEALSQGDALIDLEISSAAEDAADEAPEADPVQNLQQKGPDVSANPASQIASPVEEPTAQSAPVSPALITPVKVPDLGGDQAVAVIEVCVAPGDTVEEGDGLIVLESDKASMEVPSPRAGKVVSVTLSEGSEVSAGDEILELESVGGEELTKPVSPVDDKLSAKESDPEPLSQKQPSEIPTPSFASSQASPATQSVQPDRDGRQFYAGPAVRKLAREMGVSLEEVKGSGPRHRITKNDLKAYVKEQLGRSTTVSSGAGIPSVPTVDFSQFGPVRIESMSKIHKVTAEGMHRSWLNVPHVTQFDDIDVSELEDFRESMKEEAQQRSVKLTPIPFLLKACASALKANPKFNVSLHSDGESIVYKEYVHIGMAVDTPAGLMVPVVRDVDRKSLWELSAELAELAQKAKDRKLSPAEMQGGCFTISSLGSIGGQGFTPVVNTPEVAILGVSRLTVKPVWDGKDFVPRKMLPVSLSYDHRAVNGADAGRFLTYLGQLMADIRRMLL